MTTIKKQARLAGLMYFGVIIFGIFAEIIRNLIYVKGDATATIENIKNMEFLYRFSFVSDLFTSTWYLLLPIFLYQLLKHINKTHAIIMVAFVVAAVGAYMTNMLNQFMPLLILRGDVHLESFNQEQLNSLSMLFFGAHGYGYLIAQTFHGLWLLPLGSLVYKSGYFPKFLGILLIIAAIFMVIEVVFVFLFPSIDSIVLELMSYQTAIAEILFCLWALIAGARDKVNIVTAKP